MSSSELSNALNPHIIQTRSRTSNNNPYGSNFHPVAQPPQQHVPHRSELELAISEPPPPPPPPRTENARPPRNTQGFPQAFNDLMRRVMAIKEGEEIERKRRQAWEQEQEAKYNMRQAEMEKQILELKQEIVSLKSVIGLNPGMPASDQRQPPVDKLTNPQQPTPNISLSPESHSSPSNAQPTFVQGSSTQPYQQPTQTEPRSKSPDAMAVDQPSTQFIAVNPEIPASKTRKRPTPALDSDEESDSSDSDGSGSLPRRPYKRTNGHDARCLTIQHAIRDHFLLTMQIASDKDLPDSHIEGTPLRPGEPIRFVWEKTPKQSVHNGRMKQRFLADLKAKRRLYKHVPDKEFNKKTLESAFDQAFVTLRQKYKAQRDATAALNLKRREEAKAMKARRLSRKKTKLSTRSDTRNGIEAFEHITFDGALQMDCMSSEESASEDETGNSSNPTAVFRVRGLPWRSTRLLNFYSTLDEGEQADKVFKPKRGVGRRERCIGPVKSGFYMPPKGIASWMISQRWLNGLQITSPDLVELLKDLVHDPPGFDWSRFLALGGEDSEAEDIGQDMPTGMIDFDDIHLGHTLDFASQYIPQRDTTTTTSSLHNALATM